jgi:glyoxylase-like metal-dependent hydrolase (beta-lactamase superfamily II)
VAAHGGAELLDHALDIRLSYTGTYLLEGHFARPWAHKDYRLEGVTLYSADLQALKSETTFFDGDRPIPSFLLVGEANGLRLDGGGSRPDSLPQAELASSRRDELEILPHEYLSQARAGAAVSESIRAEATRSAQLRLTTVTLEASSWMKTHLLKCGVGESALKHRRSAGWRTFTDYVERNGVQVPRTLRLMSRIAPARRHHRDHGSRRRCSERRELTIAAFRAAFETWTLQPPKPDNSKELLPVHDLGNGAYVVELPPSDARSLLVAFSDFSVIVEAGDYSEISARLLATADHLLPDQPVRYVAMSHHHPLYANGLRPYVQRGITVLATEGNVSYLRDLAERPYRIHPDAQQRDPRKAKFEVIRGTRVIEDGKQRLEFHEYDYSTHVDEFVLAYLPSHKLIVTADQVYILRDEQVGPANVRELAIHRVVKERGLDVQSIMQTWYLKQADHTVPYSVLEEKVRLAEAKASKK